MKSDGLGLEDFELLGDVGAIDVGDEMDAQAGLAVGLEGLGDHDRAEVGAADADVDDIGDRLAGISLPLAGADGLGEFAHVRQHGVDAGHDVLAIDQDRAVGAIAQGDVQDGPVFGDVDLVAAEHAVAPFLDLGLSGQIEQQAQGFIGDAVFGEIQENVAEVASENFSNRFGSLAKRSRMWTEEIVW